MLSVSQVSVCGARAIKPPRGQPSSVSSAPSALGNHETRKENVYRPWSVSWSVAVERPVSTRARALASAGAQRTCCTSCSGRSPALTPRFDFTWTESCSQSPHASVDVRVQAACPSSPFSVEWGKAVGAELRVTVPSHCIVPRRSDAHSLTQGPSEFAARSSQSRAWLASRESPSQPDKKERPSS